MEIRKEILVSDAEWYCHRHSEEERFYEIFFQMRRKYGVRWAGADEKERRFVEKVTRVTCERERTVRLGLPLPAVRPAFASWPTRENERAESMDGKASKDLVVGETGFLQKIANLIRGGIWRRCKRRRL